MSENISELDTIPSKLKYWSQINPETPAFIFIGAKKNFVISREEMYVKAGKMASILKRIGACKGDVVSMVMRNGVNCPDRLICELGIHMAGCVSFDAFGERKSAEDTVNELVKSNTKILITDKSTPLSEDKYITHKSSHHGLEIDCPNLPSLKHILFTPNQAGESLDDLLKKEADTYMELVSPEDRAVIETTSGTTGLRKLVPHTHKTVVDRSRKVFETVGATSGLCFYNDRSFAWGPGTIGLHLCTGLTRFCRNMIDKNVPSTLEVIQKEKFNFAFLSVEDIYLIFNYCKTQGLSEPLFNTIITAGQPLRTEHVKKATQIAKYIVNMYASTECEIISTFRIDSQDKYKDFCAGFPSPDVELLIVGRNDQVVQSGEKGEIYIKGPNLTAGYITANGINRKGFTSDGWFKSGDVGFIDSTGMLVVEGRGSDVIMRGDDMIYPFHVEQLIRGCPSVEDVVVVGVPDPVLHHEMCAIVQGAEGFDDPISDLKAYLSDVLFLSEDRKYNRFPKYYLLCDTILHNRNGKVDRKQMTQMAIMKLSE